MNFGEGVQKISSPVEPATYIQPLYPQSPVQKIEKVKSGPEQFFSREKFNEMKDLISGKPENFKEYLRSNSSSRGKIMDFTV